ncbi:LemA family protein [Paludisphaera mucosa]|uniref:LemA family protein n=1 Tax=Paludisphaera mucosa TaxID=3030827 RepID=A0ABT6FBN1_9BACT|nr:LemA family protein [Paludisphaera mucosa]
MTVFWIVAGVVALALAYLGWTYNRLISLSRRADGAWSDIDVQLKRRWDLVPALVETVKGYARHETGTLEGVVQARTQAAQAATVPERGATELGLSGAVGRLFAIAEAYPELKAGRNFQELHRSLVDVENNVQYARRYYNAVVRDLNTLIEAFPTSLVASAAGFAPRPFFQIDEAQRATPRVGFDAAAGPGDAPPAAPRQGEARP